MPVSPFEELRTAPDDFPFDEQNRQEQEGERGTIRDDRDPSENLTAWSFPKIIFVPIPHTGFDAGDSLDDDATKERPLTPHPSFDEGESSAKEIEFLHNVSTKFDDVDWPSDEEEMPLSFPKEMSAHGPLSKSILGRTNNQKPKYLTHHHVVPKTLILSGNQ